MNESISFDRAADFYDATRALPPEVAKMLTDTLLQEISRANAEWLLEIGIGTGRVSRPLMANGIRVVGCDIAPGMMQRLRTQLGPGCTIPDLVLGDATRLPLKDGSVPVALVVHVLHLVGSMPSAVAEIARVMKPDGVLLRDTTRHPEDETWDISTDLWDEILAKRAPGYPRRRRPATEETSDALRAQGASLRTVCYLTHRTQRTPRERLERVRNRVHSWSWEFPDDLFREVFAVYERRFRAHYQDLDQPHPKTHINGLQVWTFR